jgi:AcrR family transcriptional regulator
MEEAKARVVDPSGSLAAFADDERPQVRRILDGACRAIAREGFDRVRFSDVAEESGISIGSIQHYFGNLGSLRLAALHYLGGRVVRTWREATPHDDYCAQLARLMDAAIPVQDGTPLWNLWFEFWAQAVRNPEVRPQMRLLYDLWSDHLFQIVTDGQREGVFDPREPINEIVLVLVALVDGLGVQALVVERERDEVIDVLFSTAGELLAIEPQSLRAGLAGWKGEH